MGYYMYQRECNFFLPKENHEKALQAVMIAVQNDPSLSCLGNRESIQDFLTSLAWTPQFDYDGNIDNLNFTGNKSWKELDIFQAIAPYVKAGSFIEMSGEDGAIWRFQFNGKTCIENYPAITWD
jgi:hypothetical protein